MTLPTLPTFYYLDHFTEMMGSVAKAYESILAPEHHGFIANFGRLSKDAQCLLIRMLNRRGTVFKRSKLRYAEIGAPEEAFVALSVAGYVRALLEQDYVAFLAVLSKAELLKGAKLANANGVRSNWSKQRLIDFFLREIPFEHAAVHCEGQEFVVLDNLLPVHFLLYLYFGKTEDDLKRFALRDLGIMRTNKIASLSARFTDGEEALACFHYSRLSDTLVLKTLAVYRAAVDAILDGPPATTDYAADLRSKVACQTGQFFEKHGDRHWPRSSIARGHRRIAMSALYGCSMQAATRRAPKNCCAA